MKKYLYLSFFLFVFGSLRGQKLYELTGTVRDSLDNQPLVGATVTVNYGERNTFVDENGNFSLLLPYNEVALVIRYVGYVPFRTKIKLPKNGLSIALQRVENTLQAVIVSGEGSETVKRPILGISTLNIKTIEKLPSALGEVDILKGLQLLPGISSVGEASNGVNVRGGTTDQNLMLLENTPIFNPTHMFGLFSAFPSNAVSKFDLYKGSVPARYGGRTAAVLDVKLSNPSLDKFKMEGGVSLVSEKLKLEMPLVKNKLGLMLAGRGAFNDFLLPLVSDQLKGIKANFRDGAAKLFYQINDKQTLSLSGYYSYDFFQTELLGSVNNINASASQYEYSTKNLSANWFWAFNNKLNLQTIFAHSHYQPNMLLPETDSDNVVRIEQAIDYNQVKSNLNYYKGKHNFEFGLDAIHYKLNPGKLIPGTSPSVNEVSTPLEYGLEMAASVEDMININDKTSLSAGLRYSYFLNLGPTVNRLYLPDLPRNESNLIETQAVRRGATAKQYGGFEPRVGFRYSINPLSSIKAGYNMARQYLQIVSNTTTPIPTSRWKLSDINLLPQVSQLFSLGYFKDSRGRIYEFSAEGYYRDTEHIVDYKPGANFLLNPTPETEILQGKNKSYGLELMVSKKKGELTGWVNYTYARSLNKVNQGNSPQQQVNSGKWYPANYDRPHTLNATVVINQGAHHDFSFNFTYSTGRPFSTPIGYVMYQNQVLPFYTSRNGSRIPDYHRLDFAWNIYNPALRNKKFKGNFAFTIYNLYGRKNAYSIFFKSEGFKVNPYRLTIFGAPIVSLSYKFTLNH
ncbi:TonB-dependent receptor [Marinilongibacter aquaticus]|uniref:TonB-dependent receptor n=1 Tax=Marinilongibacter aquaticus TaxID=2975157 RepID=UPI0021BD9D51|nr:TonB-dependent receptor [Marinilongibacter aquaticus]UBM60497.1 TonB-dependent receptor [Marinilongibacter aquaticus]